MVVYYSIVTLIFVFLYFVYHYLTKNNDYWKKKNVPYEKPSLLFGNYKDYILLRKFSGKIAQDICKKFPDAPYVGTFYGTEPALLVKDPNFIKLVMTKDYYYFSYREISQYIYKEFLTHNMFFNGGDTWNVLRQNFTPLFTSAKLKNMFYLVGSCADSLDTTLSKEISQSSTVEVKSLLARYMMDCIGSCAFGIDTGCLKSGSSYNIFKVIGEKIFDTSNFGGIRLVVRSMWPAVFYGLGYNFLDPNVKEIFEKLITEVFESRQYKESSRHDIVDFVLSWKKKNFISGDSIRNRITGGQETVNLEVDDNLLIGQCVLFFGAAFETTSTTIGFLLLELAKDNDAQTRVIKEVDNYYKKYNGKIEYECVNEMPFVQACASEALRLYPVQGILTREVSDDYTFPTGLRVEKGTRVHIPVYYLHHNPEYFPEPEKFRPERFLGDEERNIRSHTYMPFGEGPRICLGLRFGRMALAAAILVIFKKYRIELDDGMPQIPILDPRTFATQAYGGINIKFIPREA